MQVNGKVSKVTDSRENLRALATSEGHVRAIIARRPQEQQAGKEWNDIRERIIRTQCRIMRDGYWSGRVPFGYRIVGDRYRKGLVPAATADYVPAVYARAIKGESLQKIADWLTAEGVPTETGNAVWSPGTVKQILSNATYSGTHTRSCVECGGSHDITVPALVDMATQRRAAQLLDDGLGRGVGCRSGRDRRTVSTRCWSGTAVAGWRRWHDLPSEGAPGRDNDQLPITGAHCEGTAVSLLENAQDVCHHLAATSCGPAPPDHDPPADIGGGEPDL